MGGEPDLPPPAPLQAAIAAAVHGAVAAFTGTDGYGHCFLYAAAGRSLARETSARSALSSCWVKRSPPRPASWPTAR